MANDGMLFRDTGHPLEWLLANIAQGDLALPDIQRPFVWSSTKVRDLFDSMFRGFPVGFLLLWESPHDIDSRQVGVEQKSRQRPKWLIIDGQQRLTSLYAVMRGIPILDKEYREKHIHIAFCPLEGKFEVTDAAIRKDPMWLPDITEVWAPGSSQSKLRKDFIQRLAKAREEKGLQLTEAEEEQIEQMLNRLFALKDFRFTALEVDSGVAEDQVAEIFVRINSQGVALKQADFILTLMSVNWPEGRVQLEEFCTSGVRPSPNKAASSYNYVQEPDPAGFLRASSALAFNRARLRFVYQILRGRNPETQEVTEELRESRFRQLETAQQAALNLNNWHGFIDSLRGAGFLSKDLISSELAVWYSYAIYLIGRERYQVSSVTLDWLIPQWFVLSLLTSRYTGSSETQAEEDLQALHVPQSADEFIQTLRRLMDLVATDAYWKEELVKQLDSSGARNTAFMTFLASQNARKAPVLFSQKLVRDLMDPQIRRKRTAIEKHHLFPKAFLKRSGITDQKQVNQVANLAILEWPQNLKISDEAPQDYAPRLLMMASSEDAKAWSEAHALPENWYLMEYDEFLLERRKLMAQLIRQHFESLCPVTVS
ncbi:MAG: hypothetical protein GEEBNDBF_01908 [bacterium]|nr:hypothetical protein [bacterium]